MAIPNLSQFSDSLTAHTNEEIAHIRAANVANHITNTHGPMAQRGNIKNVLELCVGPSLKTLDEAYRNVGIKVVGNDIDFRWRKYHFHSNWIIGDCMKIPWDTELVIFAPPLSRGCSGKREDSLMIEDVKPSYYAFLDEWRKRQSPKMAMVVLPGRSGATR